MMCHRGLTVTLGKMAPVSSALLLPFGHASVAGDREPRGGAGWAAPGPRGAAAGERKCA